MTRLNTLFVWDFDGVIAHSKYEPLMSSYASFGLTPSKHEIDYYLRLKKDIHNVNSLQKKLCGLRSEFNIPPKRFQEKLFSYRKINSGKKEYCQQFKPTIFAKLLKVFSKYNNCVVLTSRDRATVERFMEDNHIQLKQIITTASKDLNKSDILNKQQRVHNNIVFIDDMPTNFIGISKKIKTVRIINFENIFRNVPRKIFEIIWIFYNGFLRKK